MTQNEDDFSQWIYEESGKQIIDQLGEVYLERIDLSAEAAARKLRAKER